MPVGFNSPARNLFLLGSSGAQVVTNFFKTIDQSAGTDGVYLPDEIKYNFVDQKFVLAGSAEDSNSKGFGWFEKRDETGAADWDVRIEAGAGINTTLRAMELDSNDNLIVVGKSGNAPWIAKYSNGGVIDWQATTFSGDVEYTGVTSDSNGIYYACGNTPTSGSAQAFVEKYTSTGTPDWGKSAFMLGRDVVLNSIAANTRGEVVAVGYLEDDVYNKGYIVKIDTNTGDVLWDRTLTPDWQGDMLNCTDVYIDSNDQIYVTVNGNFVGYLLKYTAEGNMVWQKVSNDSAASTITFDQVKSDGETEQTIVFGTYTDPNTNDIGGVLSKYSKNGNLVWRRTLLSSFNNSDTFANVSLDADPSFYYLLYIDGPVSGLNGTPDTYTFGKVSSSGNGLGDFQYAEGTGETIDYEILSIGDTVGRLSDGSVRQDTSDLIAYPFNANKLLFDDLATQVSNKKRQMDTADSFEYSGSPAIRPADFQELNLLADNVSGRTWTDSSGKGNNGLAFVNEPFIGAGGAVGGGTTSDYMTVSASGHSDFNIDGDFTVEWWHYRSSTSNTFMWTVGDSSTSTGLELYWGTSGSILKLYTNNGANELLSATSTPGWNHYAVVRNGSSISVYYDGVSVGSITNTTTFSGNFTFGEFYQSGITGGFAGPMSNFRYIKGTALYTSNFTPSTASLSPVTGTKLLTCQGFTIADASANNFTITVNGNVAPINSGPTYNSSGYWDFDGTDDYVELNLSHDHVANPEWAYEIWFRTTSGHGTLFGQQNTTDPNTATGWVPALHLNSNGTLRAEPFWTSTGTSSADVTSGTNYRDGNWHHVVVTRENNIQKVYVDGSLETTGSSHTPSGYASVYYYFVGAGYINPSRTGAVDGKIYFDGDIGDFRFYKRPLTAAQVFQNYNATKETYTGVAASTNPGLTSTRTP